MKVRTVELIPRGRRPKWKRTVPQSLNIPHNGPCRFEEFWCETVGAWGLVWWHWKQYLFYFRFCDLYATRDSALIVRHLYLIKRSKSMGRASKLIGACRRTLKNSSASRFISDCSLRTVPSYVTMLHIALCAARCWTVRWKMLYSDRLDLAMWYEAFV